MCTSRLLPFLRWRHLVLLVFLLLVTLIIVWIVLAMVPSPPDPALGWRELARFDGVGDRLAWSPDGKTLASDSSDFWSEAVILWNAVTWKRTRTFPQHTAPVIPSWSPDGRILAEASRDGTVTLWYGDGWTRSVQIAAGSEILAVSRSSDGKYLATGAADGTASIWTVDSEQLVVKLIGDRARI